MLKSVPRLNPDGGERFFGVFLLVASLSLSSSPAKDYTIANVWSPFISGIFLK